MRAWALGRAAAALAAAASVSLATAALFDELASSQFLNVGLVNSTDTYRYLGVSCGYLEPENITSAQSSWGQGGACPYLFIYNESSALNCSAGTPHQGFDRPGGDYKNFPMPTDNVTACEAACCDDPVCMAWVYASSAPIPFSNCQTGDHCCYLKSTVPDEKSYPGLVNGVMNRGPIDATPPPVGMRSAVPLGGMGAGALELRADGSVHEVTIINQSPAGAAKFGVLGDMFLGVRAGSVARPVRTQPPAYAGPGVQQIAYSGSYPLSRLAINDPALPVAATAFAYSSFVPGNMEASAYPAVTFTLAASNPSSTTAQTVSWYLALPFAAVNDCARPSANPVANATTQGYADCLSACAAQPGCAAWTWRSMDGLCSMSSDVGWSVHAEGSYCGVAGSWSSNGFALNLVQHPAGGAGGPANGDMALRPVLDSGSGPTGVTVGFGVANDPAALWTSFASTGTFAPGNGIVASGTFTETPAAHGAASVTATIPPGGNVTLSLVFAWYFPDRDHMGVDIGNYYSTLWDNAAAVAQQLADQQTLERVVGAINAHHSVFLGTPSSPTSMPDWIADHMVNMFSHFRGLIWFRDGRLREFEANDCPDVDSIHNDYQRHLLYLWSAPEFELSKLRKWGSGQAKDGHIWEYLGSFGLGPIDVPGGRIMGDTTTLWVMEILEMYRNTGDEDFLQEMWPTVKAALYWQIGIASQIGLPWHLVCTYDIIDFDQYNTTTFNSFLHLAMMKAGMVLAEHVGDAQTVSDCSAAFVRGQASINALLWNSSLSYFRAYTGGDAIMADCLYGQMVAHHHGLGWLMPQAQIDAHLAAELKYNGNPYGLTVVTGRHEPPPAQTATARRDPPTRRAQQAAEGMALWANRLGVDTQDDTCWMGAGPDWSYVAIALGGQFSGGDLDAALDPAKRSLENWRSRLNDLWNIAGLTSTGDWGADTANGQPWITSHYGFMLTSHYLVPVLSGQMTNIPNGTLTFAPVYPCPFNLPAVLAGTEGSVSCDASGTYTFSLAFGRLELPAGGLSVNGKAYPSPVELGPGESVSW